MFGMRDGPATFNRSILYSGRVLIMRYIVLVLPIANFTHGWQGR